jgi:SNF2 family DNA or RNA helicase
MCRLAVHIEEHSMELISLNHGRFVISFPYNPTLVYAVKEIPGRRFLPDKKVWTAPLTSHAEVKAFAVEYGFEVDDAASTQFGVCNNLASTVAAELPDFTQPFGPFTLFTHQITGAQFLIEKRKAILADDMGLGKTLTALIAAQAFHVPIVVICPVSLRDNWQNEAKSIGIRLHSVHSWAKVPDAVPTPCALIVDEAHYCQAGSKSIRGERFLSLAGQVPVLYCLTGTPIKNGRPINLLPLLQAVNHPLSRNIKDYHIHYCDAKKTPWSRWDVSGARNLDELHEKTKDAMLRRMKTECLDLPPKTRVKKTVVASTQSTELYNITFTKLQQQYQQRLASGEIMDGNDALVLLNHLRHAGSLAKVDTAIELAEEAIEEQGSVVIYTAFKASAEQIAKRLYGILLTGDTKPELRQGLVDDFQAGKNKAFVATIGAGGLGITLTRAQTVIMVDRPWTPGDTEQAEDRLHRIGQTGNVLCVWLQYDDTDQAIDAILTKKQERIEMVLRGKRKTMSGTGSVQALATQLAKAMFTDEGFLKGE